MNMQNDSNRGNSAEKINDPFDESDVPSTSDTTLGLGGVSTQNNTQSQAENGISNYSQAAEEAEKANDTLSSTAAESKLTASVQQEESATTFKTVTNSEAVSVEAGVDKAESSVQESVEHVKDADTTITPHSAEQQPNASVSDELHKESEPYNKQENTTMSQDVAIATHTPLPKEEIWLGIIDNCCKELKYFHQGQIILNVGMAGSASPTEAIEYLSTAQMYINRLIKVIKKDLNA